MIKTMDKTKTPPNTFILLRYLWQYFSNKIPTKSIVLSLYLFLSFFYSLSVYLVSVVMKSAFPTASANSKFQMKFGEFRIFTSQKCIH